MLFLFDCDDTLFPSAEWRASKTRDLKPLRTPEQAGEIAELEEATISLLKKCLQYGQVKIVSNAQAKRLEWASTKYMLPLSQFLEENGIPVISARDQIGPSAPYESVKWKSKVFKRRTGMTRLSRWGEA